MASPDGSRRREARQRAVRIPLDYFKQADALTRWKLGLTALALLVALGWWTTGLATSAGGRLRYSRGPVEAVHATWEANCDACHAPFSPINGAHWSTSLLGTAHETGSRCENCHAGPVHHANQKKSDTPSCGGCHHDHRGRDASLVQLPDSDCTRCHAQLPAHLDGETQFAIAVTRFDAGHHPPFRAHKDPGRLKFNHRIHLAPGMEGAKWKLSDIRDPEKRDRYRQQQPNGQWDNAALVQLTCASCHVLDRADLASNVAGLSKLPARAAGDAMLPITYVNHCSACHALTFDPKSPDLTIPHGLQPRQVHDYLWGAYAEEKFGKNERDLPKSARRLMPGTDPAEADKGNRKEIDAKLAGKMEAFLYLDKVEAANKQVFLGKQTCGECHEYVRKGAQVDPDQIVLPQVPEIWFKHAVFNHAAHRALDCLACHAKAKTSVASADVLLPGIDACVQCHASQAYHDGKIQGGARFDCTECHRYHNGDNPMQGIGAAKRGTNAKRSIEEFLQGTR
jgi:hypothetical protein